MGEPSTPFLTTAFAAGEPGSFPPARASVRSFALDGGGQRVLLAVASGVGDPPSAEAQAMEALGQLEAVVARAEPGAPPASVLQAGFDAANAGLIALKQQPGSVPGSGAILVAAIVQHGAVTIANTGTGAALLRRGGRTHRITPAAPGARHPLGTHHRIEPELTAPFELQPGDTLVLCTHSVVRGLGEEVVEAVFEEFGVEDAAQDLTDLAAQQPGADGAAVALMHVRPGGATAVAPPLVPAAAAGAAVEPAEPLPAWSGERELALGGGAPGWRGAVLVIAGAIVAGALIVLAVWLLRGGSAPKAAAPTVAAPVAAVSTPSLTVVPGIAPIGSPSPGAHRSPTPARPGTPGGAAPTPGASPVAAPTLPPLSSVPACDNTNQTPCRYTAQAGDAISVIGDRFTLTAACFAAANKDHVGVPVTAPDYKIGLGEDYLIPSPAICAALQAAASPTPGATPAPAGPSPAATPRAGCTPRPGASVAPPIC